MAMTCNKNQAYVTICKRDNLITIRDHMSYANFGQRITDLLNIC